MTSSLADSNKEMLVRLMEKRREIQSSYRGLTRLKIIQTIARYPQKSTRGDQYSCFKQTNAQLDTRPREKQHKIDDVEII